MTTLTRPKKNKQPTKACERCGIHITVTQMKAHLGTKACRNNRYGREQSVALKNYVEVDQRSELGQLVNLWAIPEGKIIAYQYTAYVPKWIADAYELHRKNRYAEMDFMEFLDKMREV